MCCILVLPIQLGTSCSTTRPGKPHSSGRIRLFEGRQSTAKVSLWAFRWCLMSPISYRDLALMLKDRAEEVDRTAILGRIQAYAAKLGIGSALTRG